MKTTCASRVTLSIILSVSVFAHPQNTGSEPGPAHAVSLHDFKISDVYDKESDTYFQPVSIQLANSPLPDVVPAPEPGTKMAFLDTGLLHSHPLLKNFKIVDKDFTGEGPEDRNGHGTVMTLIAVGVLTYWLGASSASNVQILNVKVLGKDGTGDPKDIKKGMQWAVDNGAQVLNMSFGVPKSADPDICALASKLVKGTGVRIIAAAGNDPSVPMCPAIAKGVRSAGALELKSPMEPLVVFSSKIAFLPTPTEPAEKEITCDPDKWRAAYLWFFGTGSLLDTRDFVRKCPDTAKSVANQLLVESDSTYRKKDCDGTLRLAAASFQIAVERDDLQQRGVALNQVGVAYNCRGNLAKASVMFRKAAERQQEARNFKGEETALNNLAAAEQDSREFAASVDTLEKALELARMPEVNDKKGEPKILENLCTSYFALGQLTEATEKCNEAGTKALFQNNNRLIGKNACQLGVIDLRQNELTKARQHFQAAQLICTMTGDSVCATTAAQELSKIEAAVSQQPTH